MNLFALWDRFSVWVMQAGLPTVALYHSLCTSPFLNVAASDASGVEKMANVYLAPFQYLFAGNVAEPLYSEAGELISYELRQRFDYKDSLIWVKTFGSYCALPSSLIIGSALKGLSYVSKPVRERHGRIARSHSTSPRVSNLDYYASVGIAIESFETAQKVVGQGFKRRPGDEKNLFYEKEALKEMTQLFHEEGLIYWLDCGTCLGAFRYGGCIPWDWDIDIAVLQPDFENVRRVLQKLDPNKYTVQDWSSRDNTQTYLKVYVKEADALIDIYHFQIHPETQCVSSILSNEGSIFLPVSWKVREKKFTMATPFDFVFPLKKINFDGIEAFVPAQTQKYLEQRYGDISPVKIYSEKTGRYEKDDNHPYWKQQYVNTR